MIAHLFYYAMTKTNISRKECIYEMPLSQLFLLTRQESYYNTESQMTLQDQDLIDNLNRKNHG